MSKRVKPTSEYQHEWKFLTTKKEMVKKNGYRNLVKTNIWSSDYYSTGMKFMNVYNIISLCEEQQINFSAPHKRIDRKKYVIISKKDFQYLYENHSQGLTGKIIPKDSLEEKFFFVKAYDQ